MKKRINSENCFNLYFHINMNTNDIQVGKYYKLDIWEDDEPFYLQCTGHYDGYYDMSDVTLEYPMQIMDDTTVEGLTEIPKGRYLVHLAGERIERQMVNKVKEIVDKH